MPLATGSRVQTCYIVEVTFGTVPASPTMLLLRGKANTLNLEKALLASNEIRADRQRSDVRYGIRSVKGGLDTELLYGNDDALIEATLCGTWAQRNTATGAATDVTVAAAGHTYTSVSAVSFTGAGIVVGDYVTVAGFTNAGNNGSMHVSAVALHVLTVDARGDGTALTMVNEASGQSVTFRDNVFQVTEGTTKRSFSIERGHLDIAQYFPFVGVAFDSLDLEGKPGAIATMKYTCMGKDLLAIAGSTEANVTSAAVTNSPMDTLSGTINIANSPIAVITGVKLSAKNQITPAEVIGSKTMVDYFPGRLLVSGELTAWLQDGVLINDFINETELEADWTFAGVPTSKSFNFKLPRIKLSKADAPVSQEKGIPITLPFEALLDSVTGHTIIVSRSNP